MSKTYDLASLPKEKQFPAMLDMWKGEIKRALPSHINPDRMCRIALTAFRQTPGLLKCEPASVFAAIVQSAQLGLEVGISGQAYLVPYGNNCQFIPGWKGLVDLVNRAGKATVWTGAVYDGDEFDYALGDSPYLTHKPGNDDSKLLYVYAIGRVKGAEWPTIEVWSIEKVTRHRDKYNKVGKRHYSYENFEMYARKVALLQVLKYMPSSPELAVSIAMNDAGEAGKQGINIDDVIDGTWAPVPDPIEPKSEERTLPELTEEAFNLIAYDQYDEATGDLKKSGWKFAVETGNKTTDEVIAFISTRNKLSEDQIKTIKSWSKI